MATAPTKPAVAALNATGTKETKETKEVKIETKKVKNVSGKTINLASGILPSGEEGVATLAEWQVFAGSYLEEA